MRKNLKFSEDILPLERDEMGYLLGGFTDIITPSGVSDRTKNKTGNCGNENCSTTKNKGESCDNKNCVCDCGPSIIDTRPITILP